MSRPCIARKTPPDDQHNATRFDRVTQTVCLRVKICHHADKRYPDIPLYSITQTVPRESKSDQYAPKAFPDLLLSSLKCVVLYSHFAEERNTKRLETVAGSGLECLSFSRNDYTAYFSS